MICLLALLTLFFPLMSSAADWSQHEWEIAYTADTDSLIWMRGLNGADGITHLVLLVQDSSGDYAYRYLRRLPVGQTESLPWPQDLTYNFRIMDYNSVDRMRPAFLSRTTLWRTDGASWDSLNLSEEDPNYITPQCFTFDSTGAFHYVLHNGGFNLLYCRDGGGRAARRDTIVCPFELGCSSNNATKLCAPRAESIVLAVGWDDAIEYIPNFWNLVFLYAQGDNALSQLENSRECGRSSPQMVLGRGGAWAYGLHQRGGSFINRQQVWIGEDGLPSDDAIPIQSAASSTYRLFDNPLDSTFEIGAAILNQDPVTIQFAAFNREWQMWVEDTALVLPTDHATFHVMVDSLGRGHLFTVDSTHVWYFGPDVIDKNGGFISPPSSLSLSAHPNPFNPSTSIFFTLPKAGAVKLTVFDVTGREVVTLADEDMAAGEHHVIFDGAQLSSGIYFVCLRAQQITRTVKVALIR